MVLTLKRWKSRTPPGIVAGVSRGKKPIHKSKGCPSGDGPFRVSSEMRSNGAAGWSSPVARQAHNLKVVGSNPTPATTITLTYLDYLAPLRPAGPLAFALAHSGSGKARITKGSGFLSRSAGSNR